MEGQVPGLLADGGALHGVELADGRTLPQRASVLGFDDQLIPEWLDLSTLAQSPSDMGRAAAELPRTPGRGSAQ